MTDDALHLLRAGWRPRGALWVDPRRPSAVFTEREAARIQRVRDQGARS